MNKLCTGVVLEFMDELGLWLEAHVGDHVFARLRAYLIFVGTLGFSRDLRMLGTRELFKGSLFRITIHCKA